MAVAVLPSVTLKRSDLTACMLLESSEEGVVPWAPGKGAMGTPGIGERDLCVHWGGARITDRNTCKQLVPLVRRSVN